MGHLIRSGQFHREKEENTQASCGENREERIYDVIRSLMKMGDYSSIRELLDPNGSVGLTDLGRFAVYLRQEHPEDYQMLLGHGCLKAVA